VWQKWVCDAEWTIFFRLTSIWAFYAVTWTSKVFYSDIYNDLWRLFLYVMQAENLKGLPFRANRVTDIAVIIALQDVMMVLCRHCWHTLQCDLNRTLKNVINAWKETMMYLINSEKVLFKIFPKWLKTLKQSKGLNVPYDKTSRSAQDL